MKTKKKRVKIRKLFASKIVPGVITIVIYLLVFIGCITLGVRFTSPIQLIAIIFIALILSWNIVFSLSQNVIKKTFTWRHTSNKTPKKGYGLAKFVGQFF